MMVIYYQNGNNVSHIQQTITADSDCDPNCQFFWIFFNVDILMKSNLILRILKDPWHLHGVDLAHRLPSDFGCTPLWWME